MNDNCETEIRKLGRVRSLDLEHRYYLVIAKSEKFLNHLYDCHFLDANGVF